MAASRSLLDLAQGSAGSNALIVSAREPSLNTIAKVTLTDDHISELFGIYFTCYHPYLPLLSPDLTPTSYYNLSPLLYWTVMTVA